VSREPLTRVAREVARLRAECGLTQARAAALLNVTSSNVSGVELGTRRLSLERVYHWAVVLGGDPRELVEMLLQDRLDARGLEFIVSVEPRAERRLPRRGA